jgi:hypothetical protein
MSGMKTRSQTSNLQVQWSLRWTIAALLILCAMGSAHAQNRSGRANLRINVIVMPIVQAQAMVQGTRTTTLSSPVIYNLLPVALKQTREIRNPLLSTGIVGKPNVVLETVTTIAD